MVWAVPGARFVKSVFDMEIFILAWKNNQSNSGCLLLRMCVERASNPIFRQFQTQKRFKTLQTKQKPCVSVQFRVFFIQNTTIGNVFIQKQELNSNLKPSYAIPSQSSTFAYFCVKSRVNNSKRIVKIVFCRKLFNSLTKTNLETTRTKNLFIPICFFDFARWRSVALRASPWLSVALRGLRGGGSI